MALPPVRAEASRANTKSCSLDYFVIGAVGGARVEGQVSNRVGEMCCLSAISTSYNLLVRE